MPLPLIAGALAVGGRILAAAGPRLAAAAPRILPFLTRAGGVALKAAKTLVTKPQVNKMTGMLAKDGSRVLSAGRAFTSVSIGAPIADMVTGGLSTNLGIGVLKQVYGFWNDGTERVILAIDKEAFGGAGARAMESLTNAATSYFQGNAGMKNAVNIEAGQDGKLFLKTEDGSKIELPSVRGQDGYTYLAKQDGTASKYALIQDPENGVPYLADLSGPAGASPALFRIVIDERGNVLRLDQNGTTEIVHAAPAAAPSLAAPFTDASQAPQAPGQPAPSAQQSQFQRAAGGAPGGQPNPNQEMMDWIRSMGGSEFFANMSSMLGNNKLLTGLLALSAVGGLATGDSAMGKMGNMLLLGLAAASLVYVLNKIAPQLTGPSAPQLPAPAMGQ